MIDQGEQLTKFFNRLEFYDRRTIRNEITRNYIGKSNNRKKIMPEMMPKYEGGMINNQSV